MKKCDVVVHNDKLYALFDGKLYAFLEANNKWVELAVDQLPYGLERKGDQLKFTQPNQPKSCECAITMLMNRGCQCGGI